MSVNITIDGTLAFPSKYIGAADLKGRDVTLTIAKVNFDMLQMQGGKKEKKVVIWFEKTEKMMVCNKTNAKTIATMHGSEMRGWTGKRITLFPTTTRCGRDVVDCIRVREMAPPVPHPADPNLMVDPADASEPPADDPDVGNYDQDVESDLRMTDLPNPCPWDVIVEAAVQYKPDGMESPEAMQKFEAWLRTSTSKKWDKLHRDEQLRVFKAIRNGDPWMVPAAASVA